MQITIQKLWDANAKYTSFKGTDGRDYKGEPQLHRQLQEGMTIEANVKPSVWTDQKGQERTTYWLPKNFTPDNGTVGVIIPQPQSMGGSIGNGISAPPRQNVAPAFVPKDDELITRLAILKSLIEGGHFMGDNMDTLVELAWITAPKMKAWPK